MKKKLLAVLGLTSIAALSIGTTLSLQSSEASDYNTQTVGKAKIEQIEQQRDGESYVDYKQDKLLVPTTALSLETNEDGFYAPSVTNASDKIVSVKNTGTISVYYRTVIAVEAPVGATNAIVINKNSVSDENGELINWSDIAGFTTIGDTQYKLYVATYRDELAKGETSKPSLLQLVMSEDSTNKTVEKFGNKVDILVVSQAVQSDGFADAPTALNRGFGEITTENHPWVDETPTINEGVMEVTKTTVLVEEPFYNTTSTSGPLVIEGNGSTVIQVINDIECLEWKDNYNPTQSYVFAPSDYSKVTINDINFEGSINSIMLGAVKYYGHDTSKYNTELNNVNVVNTKSFSHSADIAPAVIAYGNVVMNNTNIYGTTLSELDNAGFTVYDLAIVNYSNTTLNNSKVGTVYMWEHANLVVEAGSTIDTIYMKYNKENSTNDKDKNGLIKGSLEVKDGATVKNIVAYGKTYTYEEWKALTA